MGAIDKTVSFETNKLRRQLNTHGKEYIFIRYKQNEFKEDTDEVLQWCSIVGLFHVANVSGHITENTKDGSRTVTKPKPLILCLMSDISKQIMQGDYVTVNGKEYRVTDCINVLELNYALDISIEVKE